ncbi:tRNA pseudouridine(55) synthase TruB [Hydrogenimonas sp.]
MQKCPNRLFVAKKPMFIGSNTFLSQIKRRYKVKKAGFSGTLDPFACGVLIIAFGQYTKLFRFLKKTPKTYRAVLWLGAISETLDIEKVERIEDIPPLDEAKVREAVESFVGDYDYVPPRYSAKKIEGRRAYEMAREGEKIEMKPCRSRIDAIRYLHYRHPFVTFEADVSEGTYIRSLGESIAKKLGCDGALSYLERLREGKFVYENEKALNPLDYLEPPLNHYLKDPQDLMLGKKLRKSDFSIQEKGEYTIVFDDCFAIVSIDEGERVRYLLNKVKLCSY